MWFLKFILASHDCLKNPNNLVSHFPYKSIQFAVETAELHKFFSEAERSLEAFFQHYTRNSGLFRKISG